MSNINFSINVGIDVDGTLTKEVIGKNMLYLSKSEIERAMINCTPKDGIDILFDDTLSGYNYNSYIITGRKEEYRYVTVKWLDMYGIPYDELIMFPNDFYKINGYSIPRYVDLKIDIHKEKDIHVAFDDNEHVIKGLNDSGVSAYQVRDNFRHAFEKVLELKDKRQLKPYYNYTGILLKDGDV